MSNAKLIGLKIKDLRGKKSIDLGMKYTGEMLANDLGISRSYLGDIESGRRKPPADILAKMSDLFDIPLSYFDNDENVSISADYNVSLEEFDEETMAIVRDIQKLSDSNKDLLIKLIKSMTSASYEEVKK